MITAQDPARAPVKLLLSTGTLRGALQRSEFVVYYQPTVRFKNGRIDGLEALVRWRRPGYGLVPPSDFIPEAEANGFINELGAFVLREACQQVRRWQRMYHSHARLSLAVNVSPGQLSDPNMAAMVASILEETSFDPHRLILEVTESLLVGEGSTALEQLQRLHDLGIRISIDDFGTGYSSLSRLHRLPVSRLKIDQSFVGRLMNSDQAGPLVTATIQMAHGLGMHTTAEGIETREQWSFLRRHGCEEGQGYLLSHPVDARTIEGLLNAKHALIRAGNGAAGIQFLPGKVTTRTAGALIAAAMASGWVGAAAAPGGALMMTRLASSVSTSAAGLSASLPFVQHGPVGAPSPHEAVLAAHTPPSAQPAKTAAASHGGGPSTRRNGSAPAGKSSPGQGSAADPTPTPTPKDNAQPTDPSSNGKKAANPSASVQPSPDPSATPH